LIAFTIDDGLAPQALICGSDGDLYGTSAGMRGDMDALGDIREYTTAGASKALFTFHGKDGDRPDDHLVQGSDGSLYGTTEYGGEGYTSPGTGYGTIFRLTRTGVLTTLYSFGARDVVYRKNRLTFGSDGCLYGTTPSGGANNKGTVFKLTLPTTD
jgi:uncharacterized repeat protein (TIGR03803 family)